MYLVVNYIQLKMLLINFLVGQVNFENYFIFILTIS